MGWGEQSGEPAHLVEKRPFGQAKPARGRAHRDPVEIVPGGGSRDDVVGEPRFRQHAGNPRAHGFMAVLAIASGHAHPAPESRLGMAIDQIADIIAASGEVARRAAAAWTRVRRFKLLDLRRGARGLFPSVPRMAGRRAALAALYLRFIKLGERRLDQLL